MDRNEPHIESDDEDDNAVIIPVEGFCVNSRGLRYTNRERTHHTYTKVTRETGQIYADEPSDPEGPMDSYKSFLTKGVINMNTGGAKDCKMSNDGVIYHITAYKKHCYIIGTFALPTIHQLMYRAFLSTNNLPTSSIIMRGKTAYIRRNHIFDIPAT